VVPHAPRPSFKTHQVHIQNIGDMLVDVIAQYTDDTITFDSWIGITSPIIGDPSALEYACAL
jgi:hypothetical protein